MRSKTIIIILVTLLTLALAAVAFLIGMMLASDKKTPPAQPAVMESAAEISTEALTTDAETTTPTEAATTVTTAAETTAAATTTALPKPTITNAYMFYHNTGAGCKLYLHVEGDYAKYQYQVYIKSPADTQYSVTNKGESKETEFLVAEGLSDFGIESYKASVTAWNADKSESVEQWAYMNNAACEDDTAAAVKHGAHLFGGYVDTKSDNLNLRAKPNTNAKTLAKIPQGVQLDIYDSGVSGWYWTEFDGKSGYVSAKYIKEIEPYDPAAYGYPGDDYNEPEDIPAGGMHGTGYISASDGSVYMYDSMSTDGNIIAVFSGGEQIILVRQTGDWIAVQCNGSSGYIEEKYIYW